MQQRKQWPCQELPATCNINRSVIFSPQPLQSVETWPPPAMLLGVFEVARGPMAA